MTSTTWFTSDLHFGHEKTCTTFKNSDGSPLRPFANAQEMDEQMIQNWNAVVREQDKIYVLGDIAIKKQFLPVMGRLNGSKRLIRGNHDIFKTKEYMQYFKEIYGVRVLEDCILSHIPLHPDSITKRFGVNVHGHLHGNRVILRNRHNDMVIDPRYFSVCVEQINYTPISYDDLRQKIKEQADLYGHYVPKHDWQAGPG